MLAPDTARRWLRLRRAGRGVGTLRRRLAGRRRGAACWPRRGASAAQTVRRGRGAAGLTSRFGCSSTFSPVPVSVLALGFGLGLGFLNRGRFFGSGGSGDRRL